MILGLAALNSSNCYFEENGLQYKAPVELFEGSRHSFYHLVLWPALFYSFGSYLSSSNTLALDSVYSSTTIHSAKHKSTMLWNQSYLCMYKFAATYIVHNVCLDGCELKGSAPDRMCEVHHVERWWQQGRSSPALECWTCSNRLPEDGTEEPKHVVVDTYHEL